MHRLNILIEVGHHCNRVKVLFERELDVVVFNNRVISVEGHRLKPIFPDCRGLYE